MNIELKNKLHKVGIKHTFSSGEVIVQEGMDIEFIHIILNGKAIVIPSSANGVESLIDYLELDDFIGDIEYSKKIPYLHSVVASTDVSTLMIPVENMATLLENLDFCRFYIMNLTRKLNLSSNKSKNLTTLTAKERLLYHISSEAINGIYTIINTFEELAKQLGMSSRHLRRVLNELKDELLIEVNHKQIKLKEDL